MPSALFSRGLAGLRKLTSSVKGYLLKSRFREPYRECVSVETHVKAEYVKTYLVLAQARQGQKSTDTIPRYILKTTWRKP